MKKLLLATLTLISLNSMATGGFSCNVSLNNGTRYEVAGCIPHSDIMALCGPVVVIRNNKEIVRIDPAQNDGLWLQDGMVLLRIKDADQEANLITIKYYGPKNPKNSLALDLPGARTTSGTALVFRDVKCALD